MRLLVREFAHICAQLKKLKIWIFLSDITQMLLLVEKFSHYPSTHADGKSGEVS